MPAPIQLFQYFSEHMYPALSSMSSYKLIKNKSISKFERQDDTSMWNNHSSKMDQSDFKHFGYHITSISSY